MTESEKEKEEKETKNTLNPRPTYILRTVHTNLALMHLPVGCGVTP